MTTITRKPHIIKPLSNTTSSKPTHTHTNTLRMCAGSHHLILAMPRPASSAWVSCDRGSGFLSCPASPWSSCASSANSTLPSVTSSSSSSSPALRSEVGSPRDRVKSSPSDPWWMRPVVVHTRRLGTTMLVLLVRLSLMGQWKPVTHVLLLPCSLASLTWWSASKDSWLMLTSSPFV